MSDEQIKGSCFCGAVEFEVNGEPTVMVYCHCKDCQAWSAGPINSASLWRVFDCEECGEISGDYCVFCKRFNLLVSSPP